MYDMLRFFDDDSMHVVVIENTPWFRGKDVAINVGYSNTTQVFYELMMKVVIRRNWEGWFSYQIAH